MISPAALAGNGALSIMNKAVNVPQFVTAFVLYTKATCNETTYFRK